MSARSEEYDAVVVGARCAGAATAMLMARAGLRVLVLDRVHPAGTRCPRMRSCTPVCCS